MQHTLEALAGGQHGDMLQRYAQRYGVEPGELQRRMQVWTGLPLNLRRHPTSDGCPRHSWRASRRAGSTMPEKVLGSTLASTLGNTLGSTLRPG